MQPRSPLRSAQLHTDAACRCGTDAGSHFVLGCADGTLRVFAPTFDPGHSATPGGPRAASSATLERVVRCVGGAPSVLCWVRSMRALLTIEPAAPGGGRQTRAPSAAPLATAARLYLQCWGERRTEGAAAEPLSPRAVHLPPAAGCKPGVWRCQVQAQVQATAADTAPAFKRREESAVASASPHSGNAFAAQSGNRLYSAGSSAPPITGAPLAASTPATTVTNVTTIT